MSGGLFVDQKCEPKVRASAQGLFNRVVDVVGSDGSHNHVPAGIIAPIKVGDRTVGTLKFYYKTPRAVDRTQYALASGFAEILSTQLAIHELEVQKELTARAEAGP